MSHGLTYDRIGVRWTPCATTFGRGAASRPGWWATLYWSSDVGPGLVVVEGEVATRHALPLLEEAVNTVVETARRLGLGPYQGDPDRVVVFYDPPDEERTSQHPDGNPVRIAAVQRLKERMR